MKGFGTVVTGTLSDGQLTSIAVVTLIITPVLSLSVLMIKLAFWPSALVNSSPPR